MLTSPEKTFHGVSKLALRGGELCISPMAGFSSFVLVAQAFQPALGHSLERLCYYRFIFPHLCSSVVPTNLGKLPSYAKVSYAKEPASR